MVYIYILELENYKYYVGKTTNPDFRIDSHFNSNGSAWTKKYKPIRLNQLIPDCDDYDEDKYTKIYMDKYGINNVRGGTYSQINLDENTIESLLKMNQTVTNKCYLCGKSGHFAKNCQKDELKYENIFSCEYCNTRFTNQIKYYEHEYKCGKSGHFAKNCQKDEVKYEDIFSCDYCDTEFTNKTKFYEHEYKCSKIFKNTCYKYGSEDHNINTCYSTTDVNNNELSKSEEEIEVFCCYYCDKEFDSFKGATYHENFHCKSKNNKSKSSKQIEVFCCYYCDKEFDTLKGATCHQNLYCKFKNNKSKSIKGKSKKNICYKCGRDGHYSYDCYASKHVNGRYLN
jgi:cellular nucleic acid-binding protein